MTPEEIVIVREIPVEISACRDILNVAYLSEAYARDRYNNIYHDADKTICQKQRALQIYLDALLDIRVGYRARMEALWKEAKP